MYISDWEQFHKFSQLLDYYCRLEYTIRYYYHLFERPSDFARRGIIIIPTYCINFKSLNAKCTPYNK